MSRLYPFTTTLFLLTLLAYVLVQAQALLIPLVVAVVLWYLIITLTETIEQTPLIGRFFPWTVSLSLSFALIFAALWVLFKLITSNVSEMARELPLFQRRLVELSTSLLQTLPPDLSDSLTEYVRQFDMLSFARGLASAAAIIASNIGMILIYVLFLLLEHHSFDKKIDALFQDTNKRSTARTIIQTISSQIQTYIKIKTLISLATACISYLILRLAGISFAEFWSLLIFLLNYIPTIGSIVATLFPCLLALVQFETLTPFFMVTTSLITVQFITGNIIEPKLMGSSFNLSGLAILISLVVWGKLWGIVGMFLCVPILVMATIILANFPSTKPIAILLSSDGEVR